MKEEVKDCGRCGHQTLNPICSLNDLPCDEVFDCDCKPTKKEEPQSPQESPEPETEYTHDKGYYIQLCKEYNGFLSGLYDFTNEDIRGRIDNWYTLLPEIMKLAGFPMKDEVKECPDKHCWYYFGEKCPVDDFSFPLITPTNCDTGRYVEESASLDFTNAECVVCGLNGCMLKKNGKYYHKRCYKPEEPVKEKPVNSGEFVSPKEKEGELK